MREPKVLFLDIETSPIISFTWGLWDQNVGINQIKKDWYILSWAAKWRDSKEVLYQDVRNNLEKDERKILSRIWSLMDKADFIVAHNGSHFDYKKLKARFIYYGFKPISPVKVIDTKTIAYKKFGFTSNKLEYLAEHLNLPIKKSKHTEFEGFDLWKECLNKNPKAWEVMEEYNKRDVLVLEELYNKLMPWDTSINMTAYTKNLCSCGSSSVQKRGYSATAAGRYQRYQCMECGAWFRGSNNLINHKPLRGV